MNATIKVTDVVNIEMTNASADNMLPSTEKFQHWTQATLAALKPNAATMVSSSSNTVIELSIRVVDEAESAELNQHYRHKSGPTNILSFPCPELLESDIRLLGDLAICAPLVRREAEEQDKTIEAHWAHLTVHGVLHLNGFDHEKAAEADEMEAMEINILGELGYPNPYHQDVKGNE